MSTLARRYARVACANLAPPSAVKLADDLRRFVELCASQPLLREALQNPRMHGDLAALLQPLLERLEVSALCSRLIRALMANGRARLIPAVVAAIGDLATARADQLQAHVAAAQPLSEAQQQALVAALQRTLGKHILLDVTVDPALLGGLRCQVGDFVFDTTLRGHLTRLREHVARHGAGRA